MYSSTRDNWQRLVEAVMKREKYLELAHKPYSRDTSFNTVASDYNDHILDLESITASPSPSTHQVPLTKRPPIPQVNKNAPSGPIARKLFSSWYDRVKGKDSYFADIPDDVAVLFGRFRRFSLRELKVATQSFSGKIVAQHGFGNVYEGWLADGSPVAVKKYKKTSYLQKELEVYSIVAHPNILHLLGFCITKQERLLVYPPMAYGSVASFLRDRLAHQPSLSWLTRKEIAVGTARILAYLHDECEKRIIHCDIKAKNILLNEDFKPVIANFDIAVFMEGDSTHVVYEVRGTLGHIPPEFFCESVCSEKTDVYGYGVFLLELITGQEIGDLVRRASSDDLMFLDWVKRIYEEWQWEVIADPNCEGDDMEEVVEQLSVIALLCTHRSPEGRPKMSEVIRMLEDGEDYGERWEARCFYNQPQTVYETDDYWILDDDTSTIPSVQLSGPR